MGPGIKIQSVLPISKGSPGAQTVKTYFQEQELRGTTGTQVPGLCTSWAPPVRGCFEAGCAGQRACLENRPADTVQYLFTYFSMRNTHLTDRVLLILPDSLVVSYSIAPKAELISLSAFSKHCRKRSTATFKYCVAIVLCIRLQSSWLIFIFVFLELVPWDPSKEVIKMTGFVNQWEAGIIAGTQVWPHDEVTSDGARSGQPGELQLVELVGHWGLVRKESEADLGFLA